MNIDCRKDRYEQTEIYWENSAIRTFPCQYRHNVSEESRAIDLSEVERNRFQEVRLRNEFSNSKSQASFRSLAAILYGSLLAGFAGCSDEAVDTIVHESAPAALIETVETFDEAPAAPSYGGNRSLVMKSGRSLPLPPAMEYDN